MLKEAMLIWKREDDSKALIPRVPSVPWIVILLDSNLSSYHNTRTVLGLSRVVVPKASGPALVFASEICTKGARRQLEVTT